MLLRDIFGRIDAYVGQPRIIPSILVQYSAKFMHSIVLYSIVLRRSQLYCIVNLLLCGCRTMQCYA